MDTKNKLYVIPNWIIENENINGTDKMIYAYLAVRSGENNAVKLPRREMAEDLGVSMRTTSRAIEHLEREKFLEVHRSHGPNLYEVKEDVSTLKHLDK